MLEKGKVATLPRVMVVVVTNAEAARLKPSREERMTFRY